MLCKLAEIRTFPAKYKKKKHATTSLYLTSLVYLLNLKCIVSCILCRSEFLTIALSSYLTLTWWACVSIQQQAVHWIHQHHRDQWNKERLRTAAGALTQEPVDCAAVHCESSASFSFTKFLPTFLCHEWAQCAYQTCRTWTQILNLIQLCYRPCLLVLLNRFVGVCHWRMNREYTHQCILSIMKLVARDRLTAIRISVAS